MSKGGLYNFFRYTFIHTIYLSVFRRAIYKSYRREVNFFTNLIEDPQGVIFDIGASVGDKSQILSRLCGVLVAVEPDLQNYELLVKRFRNKKNVKVLNLAVSDTNDHGMFYVSQDGSPINTLSRKWKEVLENEQANRWRKSLTFPKSYPVGTLTIDSLIERFGRPFYIKIDVEGYELKALSGLSQKVPVISFEANFPEFKPETIKCLDHLNQIYDKTTYNIIQDDFLPIWPKPILYDEILAWLNSTELKYFEVFCYSHRGDL